jgi:hypothetical protein
MDLSIFGFSMQNCLVRFIIFLNDQICYHTTEGHLSSRYKCIVTLALFKVCKSFRIL